ncbi:MAG: RsmD family RNA methyltransferase, partial [Candidatus Gastranaerophilales bacterium]|nr:RsmD family RNA methyltransferase [Candidatus Gastranaerophilales bacterium]
MNITGGIYNGRKIQSPDEKITRPTLSKIRMGIFNTLYSLAGTYTDRSFLDMFGGSGIMGLEALSRGFKEVTVFEKNKTAAKIIKDNYNSLGLKPDLYIGDSLKLIKNLNKNFDVIYIDPPYM